ncbi:hypothetical protein H181DRAFT_03291 [Streptomyces sp. WMMB 714]|uniref:hypothetical protein n=1 Tax=Streptomyces sp. WMMB 714 TaxID=1286822 RepID=UPI0005F86AE1|nr:hypothetical protein [Streptomyces sp. WMMB 714]SCK38789.1 hypothetical protein H181DRAFT_03291 [Streptomyces sp. WMMB 714]
MNAPVSKGSPGPGRGPTPQQLEAARVRARTTGESLEQVLAVFMGAGRYGSEAAAAAPQAAGLPAPGTGGEPEHLAPVLPFKRAGRDGTPAPGGDGEQKD